MHGFDDVPPPAEDAPATGPWYRELNRYHWFVLVVAALGWLFDTMDQQLFNLARVPAMRELLADPETGTVDGAVVAKFGGYATSIFLIGWATGGLAFGVLGDRIGRAKTMLLTILIYSLCTGLSALSVGFWDFAFYRFITGLGVGGEFAVGVSLVAEVMPNRARPFALGLLQALSAIGNVTAALISIGLGHLEHTGQVGSAWRVMFVIGTVPALLAILIRRRLKEPERWQSVAATGTQVKRLGSYGELFGNPRWRKNAIIGLLLAFSGVVGLWGIGFFSIDLNRSVFSKKFIGEARQQGEAERDREFVAAIVRSPEELDRLEKKKTPEARNLLSLDAGNGDPQALYAAVLKLRDRKESVTRESVLDLLDQPPKGPKDPPAQSVSDRQRRREYLDGSQSSAGGGDIAAHAERIIQRTKRIDGDLTLWAGITSMMLNIGAFFGIYGFSYFTHYVGRKPAFALSFVAALASTAMVFAYLNEFNQIFWMIPIMGFCQLALFGGYAIYFPELFPTHLRSTGTSFCYNVGRFVAASGPSVLGLLTGEVFAGKPEPMRYAGIAMCSVFLIGLVVLPFAPETKGQPLPE
ncbi:MAG: MFS transporter [Planctomycetia bacterium]|nr:MFS transporter [Planctomycetia bacterium]